jgi:hypothetical protein
MEITEKKIKETAEDIVEAITAISLGKQPNILSNSVYKSIATHTNFQQIKQLVIDYLQTFDGKLDTTEELKALNDFRFKIVELYSKPI